MQDFKKSCVYQIYPKSFMDSDGDGVGDLKGVTAKLDYICSLGADYIWLTPFFVSPQKDNGYDVEDYCRVDPRYGTMEDFEELLREAGVRGINVMLDMVFNHVSSRHEWFRKALAGDERYKQYFFFKKGKGNGLPPTNWTSKFGGSAWEYVPEFDEYYLHVFDVTQPDLNWENPEVREELKKVVRFWMDKGVKGFRFDVINLISKGEFQDDDEGDGRRFYTDGPRVHEYIRELNEATFGTDARIVTVGEMNSTKMEHCFSYAGSDTHELSMVFNFHHMKVDYVGNEKWVLVPFDFKKLKQIIFGWQTQMAEHNAWNAVFWCNHDQPRVVSRFGDEGRYWKESAKMLATVIHGLRGTPYIYQGEEIGMTNAGFTDISQYRDVESLNHFKILTEKGISESNAYSILGVHSRDNSRTPMQWSGEENAGFTTGTPWIPVNGNSSRIHVSGQEDDEASILTYYRRLIQMRREYDVVAYGDILPLVPEHPSVLAYLRSYESECMVVLCNFYGKDIEVEPGISPDGYQCLLSSYEEDRKLKEKMKLRPYEALIFYKKGDERR